MTSRIKNIFYTVSLGILSLPTISFAQTGISGGGSNISSGCTTCLSNPLSNVGANDLPSLLNTILTNIVIPIGGVVCALFIIYSGFLFVTARGEPAAIEKAKHTFFFAVIGTLVLLGASVIAGIIQTTINTLK